MTTSWWSLTRWVCIKCKSSRDKLALSSTWSASMKWHAEYILDNFTKIEFIVSFSPPPMLAFKYKNHFLWNLYQFVSWESPTCAAEHFFSYLRLHNNCGCIFFELNCYILYKELRLFIKKFKMWWLVND